LVSERADGGGNAIAYWFGASLSQKGRLKCPAGKQHGFLLLSARQIGISPFSMSSSNSKIRLLRATDNTEAVVEAALCTHSIK
jgi:hypothetical protein